MVSSFSGMIPTAYTVHIEVASPTQPSIPPGSVNEDQLRLGRQRQVWFISLPDVRGACQ